MIMETQFNPVLVGISIIVAILASFVALSLANNVNQSQGRGRAVWLILGALAMGVGIWSMHFIGMLACEMPGMSVAYDFPLMLLSIAVAIRASGLAFYIISYEAVQLSSLLSGGVAMAAAIAGMHYIGMYSMRMDAIIRWNIPLVVLSIVIALVASFGALLIMIRLRNRADRFVEILVASTIMGLAVSGMHYTGMLAATFIHALASVNETNPLVVDSWLVAVVVGVPIVVLALALAGSVVHKVLMNKNKRANEILGKSEEKFRRLVEAVKDYAIFMLDADGCVTTWNLGAERITGYQEGEVLGRSIAMFYEPNEVASNRPQADLETASKIQHFEAEGMRVRKDGSTFLASVVIVPLFDKNGAVAGYSTVTRDITLVKESQARLHQLNEDLEERVHLRTQALERREAQMRTITDAVPVFIAQVDAQENILFANEAFRKWFNQDLSSVLGKTFKDLLGEHRYLDNEPFIRTALSGTIAHYERTSWSGDLYAILAVTLLPEFNPQGECEGFIVIANDVTKYKEIQADLERAREAAEVANTTKSAFLANMSHEIRTPLGAVIGFSELLVTEDIASEDRHHHIEVIKRNGRLLSNIINDILDLSKVEIGKLEIDKTEVMFTDLLNELTSILGLEATNKGIQLKVHTEGTIPNRIHTDALRLRQVLFNIVGNAIKFTKKGSVTLTVTLLSDGSVPPKLAFIVTDTGEGIRPEQRERIFAPFMQADISTTRRFGGTGLGLAISKRLALMLGGDVVLSESSYGEGSTFVITIDPGQLSSHLEGGQVENASVGDAVGNSSHAHDLMSLKVLVVDDSLDNQALIKRILKLSGVEVVTANNGREALEQFALARFDLIFMDIQMPEMDGYEATSILRAAGHEIPIVALTAHAMEEERNRILRSGFDDHVTKPIDRHLLLRTLLKHAGKQ